MTGLSVELKYPNHRNSDATLSLSEQLSPQSGNSNAIRKNGSQHTTNAPVMIANVLAAFLSRLVSSVSFRVFELCNEIQKGK